MIRAARPEHDCTSCEDCAEQFRLRRGCHDGPEWCCKSGNREEGSRG